MASGALRFQRTSWLWSLHPLGYSPLCAGDHLVRWPVQRPHSTSNPRPKEVQRVIKVQIRPNESLEAALRRFKRQCNYGGVFRLAKANTWHEKRSDKRRRERRERLRNIQKATRKNQPKTGLRRKRTVARKPRTS